MLENGNIILTNQKINKMVEQQLIDGLLMKASNLGIREAVLDLTSRYVEDGYHQLEALQQAFEEISDVIKEE